MGGFPAILEGHAGMADSEGCERNPFAQDVFRRLPAKFERNRKNRLPI